MKKIELGGRHAVGEHTHALVDDDRFEELNKWRWKAKPNGNGTHVYAIRVQIGDDGVSRDIRMHRVVLGYDGPLDVDHINRDPLDNRRENLRIATRSENQLNRRDAVSTFICDGCGAAAVRGHKVGVEGRVRYCSADCYISSRAPRSAVYFGRCAWCDSAFVRRHKTARYCRVQCKKAARWARGVRSPSQLHSAEYCKAWRAARAVSP